MAKLEIETAVAGRLMQEMSTITFGSVCCLLKVHNGRIVDIIYTTTQSMREGGNNNETNRSL